MIVVLIGYPGSQRIVRASKYLTDKYLPKDFKVIYLNYEGHINGWSTYLRGFLSYLTDEFVIFALDDYLLADYLDEFKYWLALRELDEHVMCVKLCNSTEKEHQEYPVTTQWTIWNRAYLMWLLNQVRTPWEFEIDGSKLFNKAVLLKPCLDYFTNSSISSRWEGVRLDGLKAEDIKYITENNLIS